MTNGVGWACLLETGVATVVEAAMKKVEEMKEVVMVSTVEEVVEEVAAGAVKAFVEGGSERKACKILNQFETYLNKKLDREEVNKLTMNNLCLSVIAPPLVENIQYLPTKDE